MSAAVYATSAVGTSSHPAPSGIRPWLLDSMDSLSVFPSVQRRQQLKSSSAAATLPESSPRAQASGGAGFHRHYARLNALEAQQKMIYSYHSKLGHSLEPTIATSASSYLTDDGRRGDIERIPTGLVKQNRMLFAGNRQSSIAPQESPSTKLSLSRRTSEPFVNDAEPPMPRGMPTSSYLLRKSQENLLTRKAEDETTQDQTYRTIIMFNDRSRSRKVTFNAKVHNSPRSRSVGVTEHWALARPALSIPAESSATTPIPRSSEFLDLITQKPGGFPLSPNTIRRNCKQMMDFVKTRGCQLSPEEGYESQGADKDSATNEEMISMSDALSNSQLLLTELQKPKNSYNDEGSQGSSSPSESIISNVEIAKLKDDEIKRLEVELGNAQECNQQLMAQMGALAKKDAVELKKALKDKTSECDTLKKKVDKAEKDRIQWENQKRVLESKQPMDIQLLQSQKRELAIQLDREQSEKQELFMQINTLISENADMKCNNSGKAIEADNSKLKDKLTQLADEKLELTSKLTNAEVELKHRSADVESTRDELARVRAAHELEKAKLMSEISECQKEIEMKGAALQSLRLAKQEPKEDLDEVNKLKEEKVILRASVSKLKGQLEDSEEEHKKAISKLQEQLEKLKEELDSAKRRVSSLEEEVTKKEDELSMLRKRVVSLEESKSSIDGEAQRMRDEVRELKDRNVVLSDQLQAIGGQLSDSKSLQGNIEERLKIAEAKFRDERDALESSLKELESNVESGESTIVELRRDVVEYDKKRIETEEALKVALMERDNLKRQKRELEKVNEEAEHAIAEDKDEIESLTKTITQLNKELAMMGEDRKHVEEELRKTNHEKMAVEKQLHVATDAAAAEFNNTRLEIQRYVEKIHSLDAQLDSRKDSVDEQVKQLRVELNVASEKYLDLAKELQESKNKLTEKVSEHMFALEGAATKLKESEELWAEKLKLSDSQATRKNSEAEELGKTIERLKSEVKEKTNALQDSAEENESLRHELEKLALANKDFEKELQTEVVTLATSLQSVRDENASQQTEITNLRKRISDLQDDLHKIESERDEALTTAKSTSGIFESEVETLRADLKSQKESSEAHIGVLEAEKKVIEEEVRFLKSQVEAANEDSKEVVEEATKKLLQQMESFKRHNEKLANEAAIYSSLMEEKQARLTDAETRLTVQGEAVAKLEAALQNAQKKLTETEGRLKTVEESDNSAEELEAELEETREKLEEAEANIVDLNTQLHNSERLKVEAEAKIEEKLNELETLKHKIKAMGESTVDKGYLDLLRTEMEAEKRQMEKELQKARENEAAKEVLEKKNQELEKELHKAREDLIANVNRFTEHLQIERERSDSDRKKSIDELSVLQAELLTLRAVKSEFETSKSNFDASKVNFEVLQADSESFKATIEELKAKVADLEKENRKLCENPIESDPQRVAELVEENARLAGDLLKEQNRNTRNNSSQVSELKKEYEQELTKMGKKYSLQEEVLRQEIVDLRSSIENDGALVRRKITVLETEKDKLEEELSEVRKKLDKTRQNGDSPVPPPRKLVSSNSTVSTDTFMSERSTTDFDEKRLRAELEKSHRLISVLRRKLQQATASR